MESWQVWRKGTDSLTPQDCGKKDTELNKLSPAPERQRGRIDIFPRHSFTFAVHTEPVGAVLEAKRIAKKQSSRMRRKTWRRKIRKEI